MSTPPSHGQTPRWTDSLEDPLPAWLRGREWLRIEPDRTGGWTALELATAGESVGWFHLDETTGALEPISLLEDTRIGPLDELISDWLRDGLAVRCLGHKVGRRVIFSLEGPTSVDGPRRRIAKVYRKPRSIPERWGLLHARGSWHVPEILDWDRERRVLTISWQPGTSLNRRWHAGDGVPADGDRIAHLLGWLADFSIPNGFPSHDNREEIRVLSERLPVYEETLAHPSPLARELMMRVCTTLAEATEGTPTVCHRDFHDKQILLDGDQGSLIDLDLVAAGPPGLDAGNILAHLRLRALKGAPLDWGTIAARVVEGVGPTLPPGTLSRWTAATLLRLALIYSRRRRSETLLDELLESCSEALDARGEWSHLL